jgi:hypothetical protein
MSVADIPASQPFWLKLLLAVPVIGWVARDLMFGDKDNIWYALVAFVSAWMSAAIVFGLPGLYLPALALVPVCFLLLVVYAWG